MELVIPSQAMDFDFNSTKNSSYPSPPSTPRRFGDYFFSAPTSPSRMSEFYKEFDDELSIVVNDNNNNDRSDFAFDISEDSNRESLSAEDLFAGGKIKSQIPSPAKLSSMDSKLPPPMDQGNNDAPLPGRKESDRGRGRTTDLSSSNSCRRAARSVSPLRVSQYPWEEEQQQQQQQQSSKQQPQQLALAKKDSSFGSSSSSSKGSKKWRLRDFLLFRSASDGRAYEKDPLRKYSNVSKKHEDVKNASFRSTDSSTGSGSGVTRSRRKGPVSAHELHYTKNKAASEEMKKKTFLPYKQGILGRLAFNPSFRADFGNQWTGAYYGGHIYDGYGYAMPQPHDPNMYAAAYGAYPVFGSHQQQVS